MKLKINLILGVFLILNSCGIYSLSGANVEGKTIQINFIENHASQVAPQLSNILTEKIRAKILSQTSLTQLKNGNADYVLNGTITNYEVGNAIIKNTETVAKNKLTIVVEINFENKINPKSSFKVSFDKFSEFDGTQTLQSVESVKIPIICDELTDAIFNKAFLNW